MNTSYKCNCCCKETVCKFKDEYEADIKRITQSISGRSTEVSIKCKEFYSSTTLIPKKEPGGIR